MSESVGETIINIIAEHTDLTADQLTDDAKLDELGVHSLELVEIIMDIEEKFDVAIDLDAATASESLVTIGDIVAKAETLIKGNA